MIKAGIVGASGYSGVELIKILSQHDDVKIETITTNSHNGKKIGDIFPHLRRTNLVCEEIEPALMVNKCDVIFTATPHGGASFPYAVECVKQGKKLIDLSADFRLLSRDIYKEWYKVDAPSQELLKMAVYGLPELHKEAIKEAKILANPGCYTTTSILSNAPLVKNDLIDLNTLVIDAKSGVSGAGRSPKVNLLYCEANGGISAYSIANHRHTPEIEQELSKLCGHDVVITFTPHLTPMARGILAVSYAKLKSDINEQELVKIYKDFYKDATFVRIMEDTLPNTKYVAYTNYVDISVKIDRRTKRVIVITALDNLIKGASGQAVQNMNLMFKIDEKKALTNYSFYP